MTLFSVSQATSSESIASSSAMPTCASANSRAAAIWAEEPAFIVTSWKM